MSIADLPTVLTAKDNKGGVYEILLDDDGPLKVGIMWAKMQELVDHINDLEKKLLAGEERMGAEDIKEADAAPKRNKFVSIDDIERELYGDDPDQWKNINIFGLFIWIIPEYNDNIVEKDCMFCYGYIEEYKGL